MRNSSFHAPSSNQSLTTLRLKLAIFGLSTGPTASSFAPISLPATRPPTFTLAACLIAHLLEVVLYAAVLALLVLFPAFGSIGGEFNGAVADFFYFSLTCFTTLGIGDIHPLGPLRLIVGVESLNGLLLITWSASFCYLNMQLDWHPDSDGQA